MKKTVVILLLCIPFITNGQSYIPIPATPTSEWRIQHKYHTKAAICLIVEDYNNYFMNDTLINSKTYSKLYRYGIRYEMQLSPNSYCDSTVYHFTDQYVGGIRNDSGKVFFFNRWHSNEVLLYDFTLEIGDTLGKSFFYLSEANIIISIDTISINNRQHRRFFIGREITAIKDSTTYINRRHRFQ